MGAKKRRVRVDILLARDGNRCVWCCREMIDAPIMPGQDCDLHMTLEHLVPVALGGNDELSNLALACSECNNCRDVADYFDPCWKIPEESEESA